MKNTTSLFLLYFITACSCGSSTTKKTYSSNTGGLSNISAAGECSNAGAAGFNREFGGAGGTGVDVGKGGTTDIGVGGEENGSSSGIDNGGSGGFGGNFVVENGGSISDAGSSTMDPPNAVGGSVGGTTGETFDPPAGSAGEGTTQDPPIGDTEDPPIGDTEDPPIGDTEDPPQGDTEDPPIGDTNDPPDECVPTELDNVNVIVFKDAAPSGADSEGAMYVGGNLTAYGYGIDSKADIDKDCGDYFGLVVGGNLDLTGGSVNGKIAYGGEAVLENFTATCGVWKYPDSVDAPVDFVELEQALTGYSIAFSLYPINGTAIVSGSTLTLSGTDPFLNVFSVIADQLNNNIVISCPDGSSVIVNVSGENVVWSGVGFQLPDGGASCRGGSSDWCYRILWNLYEAEELTLSGIGVQGSILAPYATLTEASGGGNVDGQIIVEYLYGGIEFHPYYFTGCLELPIEI